MIVFGVKKFILQRYVKSVCVTAAVFKCYCSTPSTGIRNSLSILNRNLSTLKMDINQAVFGGKIDRYNGVTVDTTIDTIPMETTFAAILKNSLAQWITNNRRTIWFKVSTKNSNLIPILAENGFDFHHAKEGFVMMVKWLPTDEPSNLPMYAHTMIGVGGLVTNDQHQILAIREKHTIIPGMWKLPGGYVEPNENFDDAVIREVFEETGIKTTFETVVSFRHARGFNFGCSDMYIVMALKQTDDSSADIQICPREIDESKWMAFDEFLNNPNVHDLNRGLLRTYLDYKKRGLIIRCEEVLHPQFRKPYDLYYIEPEHVEPKL